MTFYQWAHRRKWWEWWQQAMWLMLAFIAIAGGLVAYAVFLLTTGAAFMVANHVIDIWKDRAMRMHTLTLEQARVIADLLKYAPSEKVAEIAARHAELLKALNA